MQLAAHMYGFSAAQIWHMVTYNAAAALDRQDTLGSLEIGKMADIVIWRASENGSIVSQFGENLVKLMVKGGRVIDLAQTALNN
jgi:imidazolonepropionase